jgi:PPK2 family polyphosphate:nucleotide phosphotransferase
MARDRIEALRVSHPKSFKLSDYDSADTLGRRKEGAIAELERDKVKLDKLQQRLWAEARGSVLLVLQAMDAGGKDGTVRSIFSGINPAGVQVTSFKAPVGHEIQHDYLWRVHQRCPAAGDIGVFNRSHYEDVLVVRVKGLEPRSEWSKRYRHINEFEHLLSDEGTRVVKCFLNVSKAEQARRLQERLDDPTKGWKFRAGDLEDRKLWPKFRHAYEDAISKTSTPHAPWYVIPADHNWVRNLAVAKILLNTLREIGPEFPPLDPAVANVEIV